MDQQKNKNLIITIICLTILLVISSSIFLYFKEKNTASHKVQSTGAVLSPLPSSKIEAFNELYNLMDLGVVITPNFRIDPIYKKRVVQITIEKPYIENKKVFIDWLQKNGYANISQDKLIYSSQLAN